MALFRFMKMNPLMIPLRAALAPGRPILMSGIHADQKDRARKRETIAPVRKNATSSSTADDLITQARQARSPSAEQGIDSADKQAYGLARPHKGPFDNATAFSAATYDHEAEPDRPDIPVMPRG